MEQKNSKISIDTAGNWPQDVGQVFGPTQGIGNEDQKGPRKGEQNSEEATHAGEKESEEEEKALNDVARTTLAIGPKFLEDLNEILIFIVD